MSSPLLNAQDVFNLFFQLCVMVSWKVHGHTFINSKWFGGNSTFYFGVRYANAIISVKLTLLLRRYDMLTLSFFVYKYICE